MSLSALPLTTPYARTLMQYRFIQHINDIDAEQWNQVCGTTYPFLRHEFLAALENSGSLGEDRGWQPHHLLVEDGESLLAVLPLYLKTHSYGEYVFDWSWADAYHRHGYEYYPKLLSAIPFTPATGPRLAHQLDDESQLITVVNTALQTLAKTIHASSWHLLFPCNEALPALSQLDADLRIGCQYHWFNRDYQNFDDFLARFSSRKRKVVRKERASITQQNITLKRLCGEAITADDWTFFYHCYQLTYAKRSGHGGYLTQAFFEQLHQNMPEQVLLVMAYENDQAIACALYLFDDETLYGRYWGCVSERDCLHFEACYYQGIEFCIERGLSKFDAGAQGEHKIQRGFEPVITYSLHWLQHGAFREAVRDFLKAETEGIKAYQQEAAGKLPFKAENTEKAK